MEGILTPEACRFVAEWYNDRDYIVAHTSGSTGHPKEIRLQKTDMSLSAEATNRFFGITSSSLLALPLSPDYIAGKMMLVRAIVAGADIVVENPSRRPLREVTLSRPIDLVPIVPAQIRGLIESPAFPLVRNVIVGGAPMSDDDERMLLDSGVAAYATYGMTETCSHVALRRVGGECYEGLPGFSFGVDDRSCLVVTSSQMSFKTIVTNDIVLMMGENRFRWLGRFDNVINTGGVKVFPENIEKKLRHIAPGLEFYVSSRPDREWGEQVVVVVAEKDVNVARKLVAEAGALGLNAAEAPKAVIAVDELDYTSSGKIKRHRF